MRSIAIAVLLLGLAALPRVHAGPQEAPWRSGISKSCLDCHGAERPKGDLNLEAILADDPSLHAST